MPCNKSTRVILATSVCLASVTKAGVSFNADFVNGFETGVYVRDDPKAFKDYTCGKPKGNSELAKTVKQFQAPIAMMKNMIPDKSMKSVAESVEIFIGAIIDLENVFMGDYDGGDFCSGLVFGISGAKMLIDIAKKFSTVTEENPALKRQKNVADRNERVTQHFIDKDKVKH